MGSWYETCEVSKLPIVNDDEVVVILLEKREDPYEVGFYVDDLYVPVSTPIYARFDDDYGFIDCHTDKNAKDYILSWNFTLEGKPKKIDNIEDLLNMLFRSDSVQVHYYGWNNDLSYFVCHRQLFDMIVNEMKSRSESNGKKYGKELMAFYKDYFEVLHEKIQDVPDDDKEFYFEDKHIKVLDDLDFFSSRMNHALIRGLIENLIINSADISTITEVLKLKLFISALHLSRTGFHLTTGKGSQFREYTIPLLVSKFINEKCEEVWERYKNEEEELDEDDAKKYYFSESVNSRRCRRNF